MWSVLNLILYHIVVGCVICIYAFNIQAEMLLYFLGWLSVLLISCMPFIAAYDFGRVLLPLLPSSSSITHTHTLTHALTHTLTHALTHTLTHSQSLSFSFSLLFPGNSTISQWDFRSLLSGGYPQLPHLSWTMRDRLTLRLPHFICEIG